MEDDKREAPVLGQTIHVDGYSGPEEESIEDPEQTKPLQEAGYGHGV